MRVSDCLANAALSLAQAAKAHERGDAAASACHASAAWVATTLAYSDEERGLADDLTIETQLIEIAAFLVRQWAPLAQRSGLASSERASVLRISLEILAWLADAPLADDALRAAALAAHASLMPDLMPDRRKMN